MLLTEAEIDAIQTLPRDTPYQITGVSRSLGRSGASSPNGLEELARDPVAQRQALTLADALERVECALVLGRCVGQKLQGDCDPIVERVLQIEQHRPRRRRLDHDGRGDATMTALLGCRHYRAPMIASSKSAFWPAPTIPSSPGEPAAIRESSAAPSCLPLYQAVRCCPCTWSRIAAPAT